MPIDSECRKAFEAWFRECAGDAEVRLQISQRYPDQYTESTVDAMWDGWQGAWDFCAAAALAPTEQTK